MQLLKRMSQLMMRNKGISKREQRMRAGRRRSGYCVATAEAAAPEHLNRDRLATHNDSNTLTSSILH